MSVYRLGSSFKGPFGPGMSMVDLSMGDGGSEALTGWTWRTSEEAFGDVYFLPQ